MDRETFDAALRQQKAEHSAVVEFMPGGAEWYCSCGRRAVVSPIPRSEAQANAAMQRHLRAAFHRILAAA